MILTVSRPSSILIEGKNLSQLSPRTNLLDGCGTRFFHRMGQLLSLEIGIIAVNNFIGRPFRHRQRIGCCFIEMYVELWLLV